MAALQLSAILCLGFWFAVVLWFLSPTFEKFIEHFPSSFSRPLSKTGCTFKIACLDFTLYERAMIIHVNQ